MKISWKSYFMQFDFSTQMKCYENNWLQQFEENIQENIQENVYDGISFSKVTRLQCANCNYYGETHRLFLEYQEKNF